MNLWLKRLNWFRRFFPTPKVRFIVDVSRDDYLDLVAEKIVEKSGHITHKEESFLKFVIKESKLVSAGLYSPFRALGTIVVREKIKAEIELEFEYYFYFQIIAFFTIFVLVGMDAISGGGIAALLFIVFAYLIIRTGPYLSVFGLSHWMSPFFRRV